MDTIVLINDIQKHLDFEKEDIDFDDVCGYEIAEQEMLCHLNMYMKGVNE